MSIQVRSDEVGELGEPEEVHAPDLVSDPDPQVPIARSSVPAMGEE